MDPKTAPTLDPKLKEAYDRVMGTSLPTAPPSSTPPPPMQPAAPVQKMADPMSLHEAPPHTHPLQATPTTPVTSPTKPSGISSGFVAPHEEKNSAVSGKLLLIAGVVFLIVYTLFWLKWFGVALPFLP